MATRESPCLIQQTQAMCLWDAFCPGSWYPPPPHTPPATVSHWQTHLAWGGPSSFSTFTNGHLYTPYFALSFHRKYTYWFSFFADWEILRYHRGTGVRGHDTGVVYLSITSLHREKMCVGVFHNSSCQMSNVWHCFSCRGVVWTVPVGRCLSGC